jgi:hypothetical protein
LDELFVDKEYHTAQMLWAQVLWGLSIKRTVSGVLAVFPILVMLLVLRLVIQRMVVLVVMQLPLYQK